MISEATLRGYVLEEVLARLLRENGYTLLVRASQDEDALRDGRHGLLVRGRGSDHQADALGELLLPAPFSLPVRLFAEAKFKSDAVGISDVRNALGVLNDVNEHYATEVMYGFPLRRYQYRYTLFSTSGFTPDAQKYALAHQISLIDLQGPAFADLRGVAGQTTERLLGLAQSAGLSSFPLNQMRTALRRALSTWSIDEEAQDAGYEAARERAAATIVGEDENSEGLPAGDLALIAAGLSEELTDNLVLGFPQGPFILVLQPDNPEAFDAFLNESADQISVDIHYTSGTGAGGEWVIVPQPRREELAVRFGIPPLLESWLLSEDDVDRERVRLARKTLFSSIAVFHHDNRLTQLRYRKVSRRPQTSDEVFAEPVSPLRRELADPNLAFRGRPERFDEELYDHTGVLEMVPEDDAEREEWTVEGVTELLHRLDEERPLQAEIIRATAREGGRITRSEVYQIAGYDPNRSLRGFTRPSNRITRELLREGVISEGVDFPLRAEFGPGGLASHFVVPPELVRFLGH